MIIVFVQTSKEYFHYEENLDRPKLLKLHDNAAYMSCLIVSRSDPEVNFPSFGKNVLVIHCDPHDASRNTSQINNFVGRGMLDVTPGPGLQRCGDPNPRGNIDKIEIERTKK